MTPCPQCNRSTYLYLSKCKDCDASFCDNCSEAAAQLGDNMPHRSATVMMYQPTCPSCGSTEVALPD